MSNLPKWRGAAEVYKIAYDLLDGMAKAGHVTKPVYKGKKMVRQGGVSEEMHDLIAALNAGDEEKIKGLMGLPRYSKFRKFSNPCSGKHTRKNVRLNPVARGANCDWGHYDHDVRLLPLGGSANAILCRRHYNEEMTFRRERAKETGSKAWEFPTWESLKKYNPNPYNVMAGQAGGRIIVSYKPLDSDFVKTSHYANMEEFWRMKAHDIMNMAWYQIKGFARVPLGEATRRDLFDTYGKTKNPPRTGRKDYYLQYNIGKARYVVSFHDGNKQHTDGSAFYDVKILHNKRELTTFLKRLKEQGYVERSSTFGNPPRKPAFGSHEWQASKAKAMVERSKRGELPTSDDSDFLHIQEMMEKRQYGRTEVPRLREALKERAFYGTLQPESPLRVRGLARHPHLNPLDPRDEEFIEEFGGVSIYRNKGNGMYYALGFGSSDYLEGMKNKMRAKRRHDMKRRGYSPFYTRKNPVSCSARRSGRLGSAPKGAVLIGAQAKAVEYYDEKKARAEGLRNPHLPWRHDYKAKDAKVYGLPDGSVLIKGKKKLWGYR